MTGGQPTHARQFPEDLQLLEYSPDAILLMDRCRSIFFWNSAATRLYGFTAAEAVGKRAPELLRARGSTSVAEVDAILERDGRWDGELACTRRDGVGLSIESRQVLIPETASRHAAILQFDRDLTICRLSENAILEMQRIESLGLLAGGIGHRYNNLLTSILGNISLAAERFGTHPARFLLEEALHSAETAAHFTGRMMAFTAKRRFTPERIRVPELVRESLTLAQTSMSREAAIVLDLDEGAPDIEGDRAELQQLLTILLLNAAEALSGGTGVVRLACGARQFRGDDFPAETRGGPRAGSYCQIRVADNGQGIEAAVRSRIFEPFFSTKSSGRGLGLPAALAILRIHDGFLAFETWPGEGTTFDAFLPVRG